MVFGNPPVEGIADNALFIVVCDYHCRVAYVNENTVLLFYDKAD